MNLRNSIIIMVIVAGISAGITRYYFPQVQYKNVEVTKEVVKTDIKTVIKTVEKPDGSKETVTEIVDNTVSVGTSKLNTTIAAKPQWMISVGAHKPYDKSNAFYDLEIQRRILGPFYLGGRVSTDKTIGISIGMEF